MQDRRRNGATNGNPAGLRSMQPMVDPVTPLRLKLPLPTPRPTPLPPPPPPVIVAPAPEPEPEPSLEDALESVADPRLKALLLQALQQAAVAASGATIPDPKVPPPLLLWFTNDGKRGYVASAWKPSDDMMGDKNNPAPSTIRGALKVQAGGTFAEQPRRPDGRRWGYWHGAGAPMLAACRLLQATVGYRLIHVADLRAAEARSDVELAAAPRVPAPPRSKKGGTNGASKVDANAPLDLTGLEQ